MVILIDHGLFHQGSLAPILRHAPFTVFRGPAPGTSGWVNLRTDEEWEGYDWLRRPEVSPLKPEVGRFILLWRKPDEPALQLLRGLAERGPDYAAEVAVLLVGPLAPEDLRALQKEETEAGPSPWSPISSVFFLGNQDLSRKSVTEDQRIGVAHTVLELLLAGNEKIGEELGFFGAESFSPTQPYSACGLESWMRKTQDVVPLLRQFALDVFREKTSSTGGNPAERWGNLSVAARAMVKGLEVLGTPIEVTAGGSQRFSEKLSPYPENRFDSWNCPFTRDAAISAGESAIKLHWREVRGYRETLIQELPILASDIRIHGQGLYQKAKNDLREKIARSPTLDHVASLLHSFFPAFSKIRENHGNLVNLGPCEPSSVPAVGECREWAVDKATEVLEEEANGLPRFMTFVLVLVLSVVFLLGSVGLVLSGARALVATIPAAGGLLIGGGLLLWCKLKGNWVREELRSFFEDQVYPWLRDPFVQKLEWVCAQTQKTLEFQVIAAAEAQGRRLERCFGQVFQDWRGAVGPEGRVYGASRELAELGVDDELLEDLRDQISDFARMFLSGLAAKTPEVHLAEELDAQIDRMVHQIHDAAQDTAFPMASARGVLMDASQSRLFPPFLARLDPYLLEPRLKKVIVLPMEYEESLDGELRRVGASQVDLDLVRFRVSGPVVWITRPGLSSAEATRALGDLGSSAPQAGVQSGNLEPK